MAKDPKIKMKAPASPSAPKIKKPRATKANSPEMKNAMAEWRDNLPASGSGGEAWRQWGLSKPTRASSAAATLSRSKMAPATTLTETEWQANKPQGGSGSQWAAWGKSRPSNPSRAGKTLQSAKIPPVA